MSGYTEALQDQKDAYDDLLEDGMVVSITRYHKQPPDPITGKREEVFTEHFEAPAIYITNHNKDYRFYGWGFDLFSRDENPPQGLRLQGTDTLLVAALTYPDPKELDEIELNGIIWKVSGRFTVEPSGVPIIHYLTIKMN